MAVQSTSSLMGLILLCGLICAVCPTVSFAVTEDAGVLTEAVITASSELQQTEPGRRSQALIRLENTMKQRQQHMLRLVRDNPTKFLELALPKDFRDSLPRGMNPLIEQEAIVEGTATVLHEDRPVGSRYLYALRSAVEDLALHFATEPQGIRTGDRIRVKGVKLSNVLAAEGAGSVQTLAATAPLISGPQSTAVIMVNFSDKANTYTSAQVSQVVFGTTSDFHKENSYQQAWLAGNVLGPYTIALSSATCDYNTLATQARNAASAAGNNLAGVKRFVYTFPQNACTWWGLGTVGGNPSHAWINGSLALAVVGHEVGHNYGLYHSHAWECGTVTLGSSCSNIEYGDTVDIMGSSSSGHYNAFQKDRLGWLNTTGTPPITTVNTGGQYLIDPLEPTGTASKALKILKSTNSFGQKTWYYVEFRRPIGFDSFVSSNSNLMNGVVIHTASETSPDTSYLLDMTPSTSSWSDPALVVGQAFQDPQAGVDINVAWVSASAAAVNVSLGTTICVRAKPQVTIAPSQGITAAPGTAVTFTVTVANMDNSACTASSFSVTPTPLSGWGSTVGSSPLPISPGGSSSTTVTITSPTGTAPGSYDNTVVVTNSADSTQSTTVTARYIVSIVCTMANPTLTLSPATSGSSTAGLSYTYTVGVINNNSPGCSAASFKLSWSKPGQLGGSLLTTTLSLASGASGSSLLTLNSSKATKGGSYTFTVTAVNVANTTYKGSVTGTFTLLPTIRR